MNTFPVKTPEAKAKAVSYLLPYIRRVPQAIVRDELAHNVAQQLRIDSALVRQELRDAATNRSPTFKAPADVQISEAEKILVRSVAPDASPELQGLRPAASDVSLTANLPYGLPAQSLLD